MFKAQEVSEAKRSATAKLIITVKPVDANPPELHISSSEGYVDENSPIGTNVVDPGGRPLKLTVTDKDFVRHPKNNPKIILKLMHFRDLTTQNLNTPTN